MIYSMAIPFEEVIIKGKDLLSILDIEPVELPLLLEQARDIKAQPRRSALLKGQVLALLFEKPSLRTRVSFDVAMSNLGGRTIYLSPSEVGLGQREKGADIARVLSRYVDGIAARTFEQASLVELAQFAAVPVINALSNWEHPCQAIADLLTVYEKKGRLHGVRLAYLGDGNNVARSLMLACSMVGVDFVIASPQGYELDEATVLRASDLASKMGSKLEVTNQPEIAVRGADVVYTDVWVSMGYEAEEDKRRRIFAGYRVDSDTLALAKGDAIFMHPLPCHRGEEVTEEVIEGARSVVFDQAENRLYAATVALQKLLGKYGN